jgi:hypothetical protein
MLLELRVEFLVIILKMVAGLGMSDRIMTAFSRRKTNINLVSYPCETIVVCCFFAWP